MVSEIRIKEAFNHVKNDITVLKTEVARLTKENEMLIKIVKKQTDALVRKSKPATKTVVVNTTKKHTTEFIASKNGGKFHRKSCPYGKNIKPKDRVTFKAKATALNKGYKACKCI